MVFDPTSLLAGLTGSLTKYAKQAADKIVKKTADGATKNIGKSKLPKSVVESVEGKHPDPAYTPKHKSTSHDIAYEGYKPAYAATYSILFLPLVISGALLTFLVISNKAEQSFVHLSPPSKNILFYILLAFTVLYALFLILAFIGKKQASKKAKQK